MRKRSLCAALSDWLNLHTDSGLTPTCGLHNTIPLVVELLKRDVEVLSDLLNVNDAVAPLLRVGLQCR